MIDLSATAKSLWELILNIYKPTILIAIGCLMCFGLYTYWEERGRGK